MDSIDYGEFFLGSAFLTKKEIFQEVGRFDEKFFIDENEADLTVRMNRNHYRILPLKKCRIIHIYRPKDERYYIYALSNRILIYWKYYPYWIAIVQTIFHSLQELKEMENFRFFKSWLKGMKRFISKLHWIGLSYRDRMGLKEFFHLAYQIHFPAFGYKLINLLYRKNK